MQINLHNSKKNTIFAADLNKQIKLTRYMEDFKKYLGVILLLAGVLLLVIYKYALPSNVLLISAMVLEFAGILAYIFINKRLD